MYNAKIIKYVILFCREIVGCVENGEWTETSTRQNEIELANVWRVTFFFNSPTNTKYRILRTNINWIPQKYRPVWFVERSLVVFS
jgi:hypothetical protein